MTTQALHSNYIKKIDAPKARMLMDKYFQTINQKIPSNEPIDGLFMSEGKSLHAFKVPLADFGVFDTFVGLTKLVFSFGLENDGFDEEGYPRPRFSLLLKVQNDDGSIQSDYWQFIVPVYTGELPIYGSDDSYHMSVPKILYDLWVSGWEVSPKNTKLCTIDISMGENTITEPLRKYVFNIFDAIKTLYSSRESVNRLYVFVNLVNHCNAELDPQAPNNLIPKDASNGKIGLIFGIAKQDEIDLEKFNFISAIYDFSAPCPPTCP